MRRAGVLINPASGRGNGKGRALAEQLQNHNQITLRVLEDFTRLAPYLFEMAQDGVSEIYISSGDGTVQAIQTILAERSMFQTMPRVCILPHGTTNLTATDIGFKTRGVAAQADFIKTLQPLKTVVRPSLRVLNARVGGIRHGMTLGAGAGATATRYAQTAFNDKGVKGNFASFATMSTALAKAAFLKANPDDLSRLDRAYLMQIFANGALKVDGPQVMFLATTLEKLFFHTKPFWGGKTGAIRATAFPYPVPNVFRWLLPLMYGGENRNVPKGALSFSSDAFEITCAETYVMDGEFFDGPSHGPLKVEAGPEFEFVVG
jgi:diacylglycerol kinase (ATP)